MTIDPSHRNSIASQHQYSTFLERANRQFARQNQNAPDPFMDQGRSSLTARPYSQYSTISRESVELIAMIVDEKQSSPLNRAGEPVRERFLVHDDHFPDNSPIMISSQTRMVVWLGSLLTNCASYIRVA